MRRIAQFAIAGAAALSFAGFDAFAWPNKPMGWGYRKIRHGVRSKPALIANIRDPDCKTSKARWSIQLMRERKWFTTTWEYVAAMKKLTFAKCPTEALDLWQEMRARGMEETPATYTAAIVAYNSRGWWQKARRQGCQVRDAEAPELLNGSMHRLRHISQSFLQVLSHTVSHGAVTACAVVMVRDCRKDICVPCIVSASTSWTTRTDLTAY